MSMLIYWVHRWMDYQDEETSCKRQMMESVHLKAISCFWLFWCLCFLPITKWATLLCSVFLTMTLCLSTHEPRNSRAKWPWTETSDTMSQNKPFKLCSRVFCQGNRKANLKSSWGFLRAACFPLFCPFSTSTWLNKLCMERPRHKNKLLKRKIIPIERIRQ